MTALDAARSARLYKEWNVMRTVGRLLAGLSAAPLTSTVGSCQTLARNLKVICQQDQPYFIGTYPTGNERRPTSE
jgi:hypothetical protein